MRSQNSDQRRYYDDDQQRDKGQQYKRFSKGEKGSSNEDTRGNMSWPEEAGSNKNSDANRKNYQEGNYGSGSAGSDQFKSGNRRRYEEGGNRNSENMSWPRDRSQGSNQQQRPLKKGFGGINRRNDDQESGEQKSSGQQRYGSGTGQHSGPSQKYERQYGNESGNRGSTEYDRRNREGTDFNQYDNRNARDESSRDSRFHYGNDYGQGYYGESENQGWMQDNDNRNWQDNDRNSDRNMKEQRNQGRGDWNQGGNEGKYGRSEGQRGGYGNQGQDTRNRGSEDMRQGRQDWNQGRDWNMNRGDSEQGRGDWNQSRGQENRDHEEWNNNRDLNQGSGDRNPNIRGSYGTGNYSNMPSRNQGGTDYNSTSRYYSRTRDNDPFV
jgi:hypothetical protein